MKIKCPKCRSIIPAEQINISTDLALCPKCNDGFKISESIDYDSVNAETLRSPPKGAWFKQEANSYVLGATTRSPIAFFLVPFMCVWAGGSLGGIYGSQIVKGQFEVIPSLFGIPFLLGSIIFGALALMTVCGKVELNIGKVSSVFVGIGPIGWSRKFDWYDIQTIRETGIRTNFPGGNQGAIIMEGKTRIKFGTGLNEKRRFFILNTLKYLKNNR